MQVPGSIAMSPDEKLLRQEISKARRHLEKLEEDLRMMLAERARQMGYSSWPLGVNPDLISGDGE